MALETGNSLCSSPACDWSQTRAQAEESSWVGRVLISCRAAAADCLSNFILFLLLFDERARVISMFAKLDQVLRLLPPASAHPISKGNSF